MAFWSKYFQQAERIKQLLRDLDFEQRRNGELVDLLKREEFKNTALEKEVTKSRNSELRTLRHHADVMSKYSKTQSSFALIAKEDEPEKPPEINADFEEKVQWAIDRSIEIDIDEGREPWSRERYEAVIRKNPESHIF